MEFFFTIMHLLDFQREFDIGGCVFINRDIEIIISRPNYEKKTHKSKHAGKFSKGFLLLIMYHVNCETVYNK